MVVQSLEMTLNEEGWLKRTALTGVSLWVQRCPINWKVAGSISGQGVCLGCRPGPPAGSMQEATDQCFSCTSMFLSLLLSLPSPLFKNE